MLNMRILCRIVCRGAPRDLTR